MRSEGQGREREGGGKGNRGEAAEAIKGLEEGARRNGRLLMLMGGDWSCGGDQSSQPRHSYRTENGERRPRCAGAA